MNDFKKGLLVGMLIIIGCGTFMANKPNENLSKNRFVLHKANIDDRETNFFMIDSWTGKLFEPPNNTHIALSNELGYKPRWILWCEIDKNDYETTVYIEEALHRLVEIHYKIGLEDEARKYAKTLGYNYETSEWYEESYRIFNKKYKNVRNSKKENKKRNLTDKIKSFF